MNPADTSADQPTSDMPSVSAFTQAPAPFTPQPNEAELASGASSGPIAAPQQFTTQSADQATAQAQEDQQPQTSVFHQLVDANSSIMAIHRMFTDHGYTPQPGYRIPDDQWKQMTKDVPAQYWDRMTNAVNPQQLQDIHSQILSEMQAREQLSQHSTAANIAVGLFDPVNLGLMALPGVGEETTASRIGRFLIGGAKAGAENAGLQMILDSQRETNDPHAVASAAVNGFLLGGTLHALPSAEAIRLRQAGYAAKRALGINEVADHVQRGNIPIEAVDPAVRPEVETMVHGAPSAISVARKNNTFKGQHPGAGSTVGFTQPPGTPVEKLFSNFADAKGSTPEQLAEFRSAMFKRADSSPKAFTNDPLHTQVEDIGDGHSVEVAAAEGGNTRVRLMKDGEVVASAGLRRGMIDAIATKVGQEGNGFGKKLLGYMRDRGVANTHEVPDRSPGFVKIQKAVLSEEPKVLPEPVHRDSFGPDSASAARATTDVAPAVELNASSAPSSVAREGLMGNKFFRAVFRHPLSPANTFSTVLRGSRFATVRDRLGTLVGSVIGNDEGSANTVGATDHASTLLHQYETQIGQVHDLYKPQWMREQGYNLTFDRARRDVQHQWSTAVGRAMRGEKSDSEAVNKAVTEHARIRREFLGHAKEAGVEGFDQVSENEHYLQRVFDFDKIKDVNRALGDQGMTKFLADAQQAKNPELPREVAEAISKGYLARIKRLGLGIDQKMLNGVRLSDLDYIRDMLRDTPDVDPQQVDGVLDMLKRDMEKSGGDAGRIGFAKHRVQFDETHAMDIPGMGRVSVMDLFNNDAEALTSRYARTMSGAIGLARVGIKSESDFARRLRESVSSMGEGGASDDEINLVRNYAKAAYRLTLGRPLDDKGFGLHMQVAKVARDYAFARSMGQGGFSIANNLVRPWSYGYAKYVNKFLPAVSQIFTRDANKNINHPLMKEIERFTGIGGDSVSMGVFNHFENEGVLGKAMDNVSHKMKIAARATSHIGGMTPGLVFGQRLMALGIVDRLTRHALGEAADLPESRIAMMGLNKSMLGRIGTQLRRHATSVEGSGQQIHSVNWASWTDLEARDAMLVAVHREARTLIHGHDLAATSLWMNEWWGRLASQLRSFPMMAMTKQLGRAIHDRDMGHVLDLMTTGTMGALSMYAQAHLKSIAMNPEDREEFLEKNASLGRLIAAGIQRNPYSGMIPQVTDAVSSLFTGHPVFDARATGLSGGLGGIPALDALQKPTSALATMLHHGSNLTKGQTRALESVLPLGNTMPLVWATNALADHFPKSVQTEPGAHKGAWLQ